MNRRHFYLILRDGNLCHYCTLAFTLYREPTIEHLQPVSAGGPDALTNLVLACETCNGGRGDRPYALFKAAMDEYVAGHRPDPRGHRSASELWRIAAGLDGLDDHESFSDTALRIELPPDPEPPPKLHRKRSRRGREPADTGQVCAD